MSKRGLPAPSAMADKLLEDTWGIRMGCDIHCFVERRIDGKWVSQNPQENREIWCDTSKDYVPSTKLITVKKYCSRDYYLFGLLNQVRQKNDLGFEHKDEMPSDASSEVVESYKVTEDDNHSVSCVTLIELKTKLTDWLLINSREANIASETIKAFINKMFEPEDDSENTRVIFWFDN